MDVGRDRFVSGKQLRLPDDEQLTLTWEDVSVAVTNRNQILGTVRGKETDVIPILYNGKNYFDDLDLSFHKTY